MEISASCLSHASSSSILHSPFSDQSHLQFYYRTTPLPPSKLCFTLPSPSVRFRSAMAPFRALADSVCDAGVEPALQQDLMKELADLKLQMKQKKKELKAHLKDDKRKLKMEMKEGKKMKKQMDVSEGKKKMKKCSADSSSSSSESSGDECKSVSMNMLRQGQAVIDNLSSNCEEKLECGGSTEIRAGLPSRLCASNKDNATVCCGGSSLTLSLPWHAAMESFTEKSSSLSDSNAEICFASASACCVDSHAASTSRGIPGQSLSAMPSRALFHSQLGSVQSPNRIEVCAGGKCKKAGSEQLLVALRGQIPGTANVEAVPCKCMGKCSMAVNVKVHKDDTNPQHHSLVAGVEDATLILNHHFGLGQPLSGIPSLPASDGIRVPSPLLVV